MIRKIYAYEVHFFGDEKPIRLNQAEGQQLLMKIGLFKPSFTTIEGVFKNVKSINEIKPVPEMKGGVGASGQLEEYQIERELTPEEEITQIQFDEFQRQQKELVGKAIQKRLFNTSNKLLYGENKL